MACRVLVPRPGIKPASPALAGRFLTTRLPKKSSLPSYLHVPGGGGVQSLSHIQLFVTSWAAAARPPFLHYLQGFVQTHVRWVSDAIQPSPPLANDSYWGPVRIRAHSSWYYHGWPSPLSWPRRGLGERTLLHSGEGVMWDGVGGGWTGLRQRKGRVKSNGGGGVLVSRKRTRLFPSRF